MNCIVALMCSNYMRDYEHDEVSWGNHFFAAACVCVWFKGWSLDCWDEGQYRWLEMHVSSHPSVAKQLLIEYPSQRLDSFLLFQNCIIIIYILFTISAFLFQNFQSQTLIWPSKMTHQFIKNAESEPVTLFDICCGSLEHINLKHVVSKL